jgi:hypothetical protein
MTKAFKVVRKGRPRSPGSRYPSGDLQRELMEARVIAFRQPHRQGVPAELRDDARAETLFGRMMLAQTITKGQYNAGVRYRKAVRRYRAHFIPEFPNPEPGSIAGFMEPRSSPAQAYRTPADQAKFEQDIWDDREDAYQFMFQNAGQRACKAVARVAVWDEWAAGITIEDLKRGLDALATHYHLTRENK